MSPTPQAPTSCNHQSVLYELTCFDSKYKRSRSMSLSLTFYLAQCPWGLSRSSQLARLHSFYGWVIFHYIYIYIYTHIYTHTHTPHNFLIWPSINRHLGCFHIFTTLNNVPMNIECIHLSEQLFLFSSNKHPEVQLLDHPVILFLIFWGNFILFSVVFVPIKAVNNSAWELPFSHILTNPVTSFFM